MQTSSKIAVIDHFRMPPELLEEARPMMAKVIEATRAEDGCIAYSYSEDVVEPGLIRVSELWQSREHLAMHFKTPHMATWAEERAGLGLTDRDIAAYSVNGKEAL
jgi:quinol monooxygenase YgiN